MTGLLQALAGPGYPGLCKTADGTKAPPAVLFRGMRLAPQAATWVVPLKASCAGSQKYRIGDSVTSAIV